jgi:hypothetical protein
MATQPTSTHKALASPPGTLSVIFYLAGLSDHAIDIICAPVPAPGSLSLDLSPRPVALQPASPARAAALGWLGCAVPRPRC